MIFVQLVEESVAFCVVKAARNLFISVVLTLLWKKTTSQKESGFARNAEPNE